MNSASGTFTFCPFCEKLTHCKVLPYSEYTGASVTFCCTPAPFKRIVDVEYTGKYKEEPDVSRKEVYVKKRVRECRICQKKFGTLEYHELFLNDIISYTGDLEGQVRDLKNDLAKMDVKYHYDHIEIF